MPTEIVFETHSTTTDNEAGVATGWNDGRLSERGRLQAAELGNRRRAGVAAVFCSDLGRAVETVEIAFGGADARLYQVYQDARLRECNYGDWNGIAMDTLTAQRSSHLIEPFPGGESFQDAVDRVADFLTDLTRGWNDQRVLLVGHSATRWALDHLLNGEPLTFLVDAPFDWRKGRTYILPNGWER